MQNIVQDELFNKANDAIETKDLYHADKFISELRISAYNKDDIDLLEARCLIEKHLLDRALSLLNNRLERNQESLEAYLYRGKIYMNKGKIELGYDDFKTAYDLDKDNIETKYLLGRAAVSCSKFVEARDIYKDLYHYSDDEQVFGLFETVNRYIVDELSSEANNLEDEDKLNIAKSYYYLADIEKAAEIMKTIQNIEELKDGEIIYSNILRTQKNYEQALYYADKAMERYSDDPRVYFYKAMLLEDQREFSDAAYYYNKAISKDEFHKPSYNRLAKLLINSGQYNGALELLNKAIEFNYDSGLTLNNKGLALFYLGESEEALKCFNESIKKYPKCIEGYVNKSMMLRSQNIINEAFEVCDKAIELGCQDDKVAVEKTILLLMVEDYQLALDWVEWAIDFNTENILAHYVKSICYSKLNRFKDALQSIDETISMNPKDIMGYCGKLYIYISMGKDVDDLVAVVRGYIDNDKNSDYRNVSDFLEQLKLSNSVLILQDVIKTVTIGLEKILKREEI